MKLLKIYCEVSQGASTFIRTGWKNAFEKAGHTFIFFPEHSNVFDLFNLHGSPDILIGTTYNLNNSLFKLIQRNPQMKVILFASAWGDLTKEIDLQKYPIDVAKEAEIKLIAELKEKTNKPDYVFIHIPDNHVKRSLGGWNSIGIDTIGLMNAADIFVYKPVPSVPSLECDVGFVGGCWPYKSQTLLPLLGRLCNEESSNLNIKIFGNGDWGVPQHLGQLPLGIDNQLFNSAKICPNISELHSFDRQVPDIIERVFKIPLSGGFLISDNVDLRSVFYNHEVPQFSNYEEFKNLIYYYLKHNDQRLLLSKKQQQVILNNHTYHHRIHKMLNKLGFDKEANLVLHSLTTLI